MSGRLRTGILIMKKTIFLFLLLIGYAETSSAQLFGPRNYDECIIEGMQGVTSDVAANAVQLACYSKFSISEPNKPRVDYEGTCLFVYSLDGGTERLTQREYQRLSRDEYDSTFVMRDGMNDEQIEGFVEALRAARAAGDEDIARELVRTNVKNIKFKKGLTADYVRTQSIPYCGKASR